VGSHRKRKKEEGMREKKLKEGEGRVQSTIKHRRKVETRIYWERENLSNHFGARGKNTGLGGRENNIDRREKLLFFTRRKKKGRESWGKKKTLSILICGTRRKNPDILNSRRRGKKKKRSSALKKKE